MRWSRRAVGGLALAASVSGGQDAAGTDTWAEGPWGVVLPVPPGGPGSPPPPAAPLRLGFAAVEPLTYELAVHAGGSSPDLVGVLVATDREEVGGGSWARLARPASFRHERRGKGRPPPCCQHPRASSVPRVPFSTIPPIPIYGHPL